MSESFQQRIGENHCFGCGPDNPDGLQIHSYWDGDEESVCRFRPASHHAAGPPQFLNGGIIATLIDCHGICTAIADVYRQERREIGIEPRVWCVTGRLSVNYLRPTPIEAEVEIRARVARREGREITVACVLSAEGKPRAEGEVLAIRVPPSWHVPGEPPPR